eukprot:Tbor_TRINITY_DN5766_c2_g6::TRINITY_DN5766_c2_g6_i1::g.19736::m.19736
MADNAMEHAISEEQSHEQLGVTYSPFALVDPKTGYKRQLLIGVNTIGRCQVNTGDPAFFSIDSPKFSISRMHGAIEIAHNLDAWIEDSGSTNGTIVSVREGQGIMLVPNKGYFLPTNARVMFGDVELLFQNVGIPLPEKEETKNEFVITSVKEPDNCSQHHVDTKEHEQLLNQNSKPLADILHPLNPNIPVIPSLQSESDVCSQKGISAPNDIDQVVSAVKNENQSKEPYGKIDNISRKLTNGAKGKSKKTSRKETAEQDSSEGTDAPSKKKNPRVDQNSRGDKQDINIHFSFNTTNPPSDVMEGSNTSTHDNKLFNVNSDIPDYQWPHGQKIIACLTGMNGDEQKAVEKKIKLIGGVVVDEWSIDVNILVVKESPASRTPKFLIAIGTGVLVVTSSFFDQSKSPDIFTTIKDYIPDMHHNSITYLSGDIFKTISRNNHLFDKSCSDNTGKGVSFNKGGIPLSGSAQGICDGTLTGGVFLLSDIPTKNKHVVSEIITGCGGKVLRSKRDEIKAVEIGLPLFKLKAEDIENVYESILRGKPFTV